MHEDTTKVLPPRRIGQGARGLLLVGHGTRRPEGTQQFIDLATEAQRRLPRVAMQLAFLELAEPTIEQSVAALLAAGIEHLVVVPLLLFAAGHARRDIPAAISAALAQAPVAVVFADALGCEPQLLELSRERYGQAIAGNKQILPEATCLLLVGRGSSDESATAAMHEFARLRQAMEGGLPTQLAFLAKAQPFLGDQLPRIASEGFRQIVVQPHLLFDGELAASALRQVAAAAAQFPHVQWLVTPLLADPPGAAGIGTELLAKIICDRYCLATNHPPQAAATIGPGA